LRAFCLVKLLSNVASPLFLLSFSFKSILGL
jgi:hypothetical protein